MRFQNKVYISFNQKRVYGNIRFVYYYTAFSMQATTYILITLTIALALIGGVVYWGGMAQSSSDAYLEGTKQGSLSEEELDRRAKERLQTASEAIIRGQYESPYPSLGVQMNNQIIDQFGVQLWASPVVTNGGPPIIYFLKARGIHFDVKHLLTFQREGYVLEYWVTLVGPGTRWAQVDFSTTFQVIRMTDKDTPREILYTSDTFSRVIAIPGYDDIEIPIDDARLIYEMNPTAFTDAYAGTELAGVRAYIDDDGAYQISAP